LQFCKLQIIKITKLLQFCNLYIGQIIAILQIAIYYNGQIIAILQIINLGGCGGGGRCECVMCIVSQ
jgi:hypothetical protein